jgi:exosortase
MLPQVVPPPTFVVAQRDRAEAVDGQAVHRGNIGRTGVIFSLTCLFFVGFFYLPSFATLMQCWQIDPNYSHGWLILPVSAWLSWKVLRQPNGHGSARPWLGGAEILAGCLFHLFVQVVPWLIVDFLGLVLILRGMCHAWGGSRLANAMAFPAGFLFFMFPLPVTWTGAAAVWLQDIVSRASAPILNLFWVCHRRGNELVIAGLENSLLVASECSGLRQLVAFLALAALIAYLGKKSFLRSVCLCLLAVPIAILANILRVLLMAMGARSFGTEWLSGWMHDVPALLTLPVGFVLLLFVSRWLLSDARASDEKISQESATTGDRRGSFRVVVSCAILALAGQAGLWFHLRQGSEQAYAILDKDLSALPANFTTQGRRWQGLDSARRELLARKIPFADAFISRDYATEDAVVNLYVVYSHDGKDREHHPEICVRDVGGATEEVAFRGIVPLDTAGARTIQRFRFRTATQQPITIYYWHYTFPLADTAKSITPLQRLHQEFQQRPPSVTVQIACNGSPAALALVEKELLPRVDQELRQLLPTGVRLGRERLPIRFLGER